jgi:hypothetical protein
MVKRRWSDFARRDHDCDYPAAAANAVSDLASGGKLPQCSHGNGPADPGPTNIDANQHEEFSSSRYQIHSATFPTLPRLLSETPTVSHLQYFLKPVT